MGAGNCLSFAGKNWISRTRLGFIGQKRIENGEGKTGSHQDYGICALGQWDLVTILARNLWESDPPSGPCIYKCVNVCEGQCGTKH